MNTTNFLNFINLSLSGGSVVNKKGSASIYLNSDLNKYILIFYLYYYILFKIVISSREIIFKLAKFVDIKFLNYKLADSFKSI